MGENTLKLLDEGRSKISTRVAKAVPPSPDAQRAKVRWNRLALGLAVMAASIAGVWVFVQSQSSAVEVWVANERIEAGTTIDSSHVTLRTVEAGSQLAAIGADVDVRDRVARVAIPDTSTLVDGHFFSPADDLGKAAGSLSQVAVIFPSGHIPSAVTTNDLLRLQVVKEDQVELFESVAVVQVEPDDRGSLVVTLQLDVEQGGRLMSALAAGEARAAIVGRR